MPMSVTNTAAPAGTSYGDIRVGEAIIHQGLIDVSTLTSVDDADGYLPVGLPILATGAPVTGTTDAIYGLIGPEPVKLQAADHYGNVMFSGVFNKDMIEDNLGRALDSNELASLVLVKDRITLI